jgi:hypothetical protein
MQPQSPFPFAAHANCLWCRRRIQDMAMTSRHGDDMAMRLLATPRRRSASRFGLNVLGFAPLNFSSKV